MIKIGERERGINHRKPVRLIFLRPPSVCDNTTPPHLPTPHSPHPLTSSHHSNVLNNNTLSPEYLTKQSVGMDPLHAVHDTLKYLVITSSAVPSEAFWLTRVFYTRRHRHLNHSSIHSSIHSTTHQFQLSPLYQLLVGLAISQGGGTIIDVLCNRKVTWIANDFLYMMALGCWYVNEREREREERRRRKGGGREEIEEVRSM